MRAFRNLKVWGAAHQLTLAVYRLTRAFPTEELYGLTSQMRRASASIAANIAEGCGRQGAGDFARFLHIAMGSASELEYHLLLAHELNLLRNGDYSGLDKQTTEVKRMLTGLIQKLKTES